MSNEEVDDLQLRVAKAIPSDVGHGRARVPFDNDLNLKPGDIVEITGEQKTAAIVWRCRPEDANLGIIRVDGIIRKNAGVSLGDKVSIRKVETQPCQKLILSPVMAKQQKVRFGPGIEGFARRGLNKRPVVSGDRIFIPGMTLFAEALPFQIVQTTPKGIVQVLPDTEIIIKEEPVDEEDESGQPISTISYEDIGGIGEQLQKVREMIELPLKHPILFRRLGIDPPRGVLLHGPPGTGKTLLAKAIANEAQANFISIKGPEMISKWVGESERGIREIFKKAKQSSPSIIFLDEFESIASMRSSSNGEGSDVGNRVVNQLLASMDGVESLDGVIVVAATNRPEMIDPALLRSGRFERVLHVPPPDAPAREAIFQIHSEGMPLSKFSFKDILSSMEGFTGADIEAVCREAALIAMRAGKKKVSKKHFDDAVTRVRPTVTPEMLEYYQKMETRLTSGLSNIKRTRDYGFGMETM